MRLGEEELGKRLREYSDDTMHLISSGMWMTGQDLTDFLNIITDSELNEKQVVDGLKKVLDTARQKLEDEIQRLKEESDKLTDWPPM